MKMNKPPFGPGDLETMNKLFLELSLVCDGATTWREMQQGQEIARLNDQLAKFRAKVNAQAFELAEMGRQLDALKKEQP
jgi:hypothetical protein